MSGVNTHLDTDRVSLHAVEVWVVGGSCEEEVPP